MEDFTSAMMFAENVVRSIIENELHVIWRPKYSMARLLSCVQQQQCPIVHAFSQAITYTILFQGEEINLCFKELIDKLMYHPADISRLISESAPLYFPDGYSHVCFVAFCSMTIGVAIFFYQQGAKEIAEAVAGQIGNVLLAFLMTGEFAKSGGWSELKEVCLRFCCGAKNLYNFVPANAMSAQRKRCFSCSDYGKKAD